MTVGNSIPLDVSKDWKGHYITLSHCWGQSVPLKPTIFSLQQHIEGIPLKSLPKTFRDAAMICSRIGVRYLWIDSLCIIQDSYTDWLQQSSEMGDIYANSYCTISATAAKNAFERYLVTRPSVRSIQLVQKHGKEQVIFWSCLLSNFSADVEEGHLNSRGWVLQERILSKRALHFTPGHFYWECLSYTYAEDSCFLSQHDYRMERGYPHSKRR